MLTILDGIIFKRTFTFSYGNVVGVEFKVVAVSLVVRCVFELKRLIVGVVVLNTGDHIVDVVVSIMTAIIVDVVHTCIRSVDDVVLASGAHIIFHFRNVAINKLIVTNVASHHVFNFNVVVFSLKGYKIHIYTTFMLRLCFFITPILECFRHNLAQINNTLVTQEILDTSFAFIFMMPQTLTRLESLATPCTMVGPQLRVGSQVGSDGSGIFEQFVTHTTLFIHFGGMHVEVMFLEVVTLFEAYAADSAFVRSFVRVCANVVLVVGVLCEGFHADLARPAG